jgi:hypothetical protein
LRCEERKRGWGERQTKDPIEISCVPEAIEETEVYEDWRDEDDRPGDGDGCIMCTQSVWERDNHCRGASAMWACRPLVF